jgi:CBS domain-containing protein
MASIRKYVTREIVTLEGTTPSRDAARLMGERRIGSIGVRQGDKLVGLVTERDLVATVLARGSDATMPIREALRPGIPHLPIASSEADAAQLMREHFTRHLLVEDEGRIVGVVSMQDLIRSMLDEKQFVIEQLQTYIDGR